MALKFQTRRLLASVFKVVGRAAEDYAQDFERWMEDLSNQVAGGIPAGFNELEPTTIDGTTPTSPGDELQGWASANHQHPLDISGVPGVAGIESAQGAGPGVSLSGHTHEIDWDAVASDEEFLDVIDARIEEVSRIPVDLRHYRRRRFLGLVDDNRLKGAVVGARRVFP